MTWTNMPTLREPTNRASNQHGPLRQSTALLPLTLPLTLLLSACSALSGGGDSPPPKEPAKLDIAIKASADLNLDLKGRGTPLLLRVYELKSEVAFQEADFFALQNADKAALGADILAVDQFIIRPGETRQITRKSKPETTAIGVFAGYRDLPAANWRAVHKMPVAAEVSWYRVMVPAHKARLQVDLQANAIVLTDEAVGDDSAQYARESIKGLDEALRDSVQKQTEEGLKKAASQVQPQ